ncbi:hypothetical protein ACTFTM_25030 [Micromonospora sp. RB23]
MRTVDSRTFLLVEGETDCALVDTHLVNECESIPAAGKSVALGAAVIAYEQNVEGVLAIVDRDWVGSLETELSTPNVIYTDAYDMESTMFQMDNVLNRIMNSYCRRDLLRSVDRTAPQWPVMVTTRAAAAVSALRYASKTHGWGIGVRDFPIHVIVNLDGGAPNLALLCRIACDKAESRIDAETVLGATRMALSEIADDAKKCSGHDLMKALSYVINQRFGGSISEANLASAFRAAVGCGDLAGTTFFRSVSEWSQMHGKRVWSCNLPNKVPAARTSPDPCISDESSTALWQDEPSRS